MVLELFNTIGRQKQSFRPIVDKTVGLYCCGPTVYDYVHVGNLRTYVFEDVLRRALEFEGFKVAHVMNITDVGHLVSDADTGRDKMEVGAERERKNAFEIAAYYTHAFFEDFYRLNILKPTVICKATDHIKEMIDLIAKLETGGYTYATDDGIYYDTSKFEKYGELSGSSFDLLNETLKPGARIEFNPLKKNVTDFALWKFSPKGRARDMNWESPWGIGFPGWHTECAAMAVKYLGPTFDIHCGGMDHIPIHHTDEIATVEAVTGERFVNYWLHGAFLVLGEQMKMAKSKQNTITLRSVIDKGFDPIAFRYLCLNAHYRSELEFTWESLAAAQKGLERLRDLTENVRTRKDKATNHRPDEYRNEFLKAIENDLSMPRALSVLWQTLRSKELASAEKYALILEFDRVLGLDLGQQIREELPEHVNQLILQREFLRQSGNFAAADSIREILLNQYGIEVQDTGRGPLWKKTKLLSTST